MATLSDMRSCPAERDRSFWWCYETTVDSPDDRTRIRERMRSRMRGQHAARLVDLLLVIDVLLLDAFDSGFTQDGLQLTITATDTRVRITLDAADAPATINPDLPKTAGETLLDLVSIGWGVRQQGTRKLTWAILGRNPRATPSETPRSDPSTNIPPRPRAQPAVAHYTRHRRRTEPAVANAPT